MKLLGLFRVHTIQKLIAIKLGLFAAPTTRGRSKPTDEQHLTGNSSASSPGCSHKLPDIFLKMAI